MNELKNRGTEDIMLAVVDGLKGFPDAITAVFPDAIVQTCIVHLLRNSMDFVSWKDRKPLATDLKAIYRAVDAKAAEDALIAFEASEWGLRYVAIARSRRRAWNEVRLLRSPCPRHGVLARFFAVPEAVRKIIYTTDVIDKTSGFKICYDLNARATSRRRAERRLQVPSGRLFTALPT